MSDFMKTTCALCPFSRTKTLWLHPERAEEFAYMAGNPYTDFPCHKTAEYIEDDYTGDGEYVHGERSKTCHGFLTLQRASNDADDADHGDGFIPDGDGFEDIDEMIDRHAELWEAQHRLATPRTQGQTP